MNENTNYRIFRWMRTKLHLKSYAKEIFAIIYSFTKNGGETFATNAYFAEEVDCSVKTVSEILKQFTADGLVFKRTEREKDGGERNHYRVNLEKLDELGIVPVFSADSEKKSHIPQLKISAEGSENFSTPTFKYNATDNPITDTHVRTHGYGKNGNVLITEQNYQELRQRFGEQFEVTLESLSGFLLANPKAYKKNKKTHFEVLNEWCAKDIQKNQGRKASAPASEEKKKSVNAYLEKMRELGLCS